MKLVIFFSIALVFSIACSSQKEVVKSGGQSELEAAADSTEYDLIVFDPKFESWYLFHNSPSKYRSQEFYEDWNRRYVAAWNYNASNFGRGKFLEPIIGYDPTVDYGFEINHKLFYYFQYVERELRIVILPGGPRRLPL